MGVTVNNKCETDRKKFLPVTIVVRIRVLWFGALSAKHKPGFHVAHQNRRSFTPELLTKSVCSVDKFSKCEIFYRGDAFNVEGSFVAFTRRMVGT